MHLSLIYHFAKFDVDIPSIYIYIRESTQCNNPLSAKLGFFSHATTPYLISLPCNNPLSDQPLVQQPTICFSAILKTTGGSTWQTLHGRTQILQEK